MFDPLRRLKYLPWVPLLQVALITVLIAIAADLLLTQALRVPVILTLLTQLFNSPLAILLYLGAAFALGALAIVILERWFRQVIINSSSLWALVGCLAVWLLLRSWLPIPPILSPGFSLESIVCVALGVFLKGKSYWRW